MSSGNKSLFGPICHCISVIFNHIQQHSTLYDINCHCHSNVLSLKLFLFIPNAMSAVNPVKGHVYPSLCMVGFTLCVLSVPVSHLIGMYCWLQLSIFILAHFSLQRTISQMLWELIIQLLRKYLCSEFNSKDSINSQVCTCYDSFTTALLSWRVLTCDVTK